MNHQQNSVYQDLTFLGMATTFTKEIVEVARSVSLFDVFYDSELETLAEYMHCFSAPSNTVLLREGEEGDHLIILLSGHVAVHKALISGKLDSIAVVGPGDILGEMSLIDGEHRFATCISTQPVRFAALTRTDLNEITALHPRLANKFLFMLLQIMVSRLRDTGMRMITQVSRPAI